MTILLIITLVIGLILIFSGYLIKKDSSVLAGSKKGSDLKIMPKAFYITGFVTIVGGGILFLLENPLFLILLSIISIPALIIYINIKPVNNKLKKSNMIIISISILFILSIIVFLCLSSKEPSIIVEKNNVKISGLYGESIPIENITNISITENIPTIIFRSNGLGLGEIKKGYFETKEGYSIKLFLQKSKGPFIKIINNKGLYYFINFKDSNKTDSSYKIIKNALNKHYEEPNN